MAHYALIDEKNMVVQVITGVDEDVIQIDIDGENVGGSSEAWEKFYAGLPWFQGLKCKRTSYNGRIRRRYAAIGYFYDEDRDVFILPKPFESWSLNENHDWAAPIPYPDDGLIYIWNEEIHDWKPYVEANA